MIKQQQKMQRSNLLLHNIRLYHIINEPTHENSSYCINFTFTSQPNLVVDSGIHPFSHPNCHDQIVYVKFNLKIHFPLLTYEKYGIMGKGTLSLLEEMFMNLIGI